MSSIIPLSILSLALLARSSVAAPVAGTTYSISPKFFPDLCVVPDHDSEGGRLVLDHCNTSDDIAWTVEGGALKHAGLNMCADIVDGGAWSGNRVQVWGCYSWNTNQQYTIRDGMIQWAGQNYCFDLTDGNGQAGTPVQIWSCFDHNDNQQWTVNQIEEAGPDCSTTSTLPVSTSAAVSASETISASATASASASAVVSASEAANSTIGGGMWGHTRSSSSAPSSTDAWASASVTPSASASESAAWNATSTSAGWEASSSAVTSASSTSSAGSSVPTGANTIKYNGILQTQGTKVVDESGTTVQLKGTNLGGWLVWEGWMCGFTDNSGNADRFPQFTLFNRFGEEKTRELIKAWEDNWLVSSDFDILASMGFNVLRLPFSYLNFFTTSGEWLNGSPDAIDWSRFDWVVNEAKARGMYILPVYHIWDGQKDQYSAVSEDTAEGQRQRDKMGQLWTLFAQHFAGETAIAAYDAINEPTGSANNILQRDLYKAIRAGDSKRIIIMESISAAPDADWTNVMYSMHEYMMMGEDDFGYNQYMYSQGVKEDIDMYTGFNVPTYIGEFMASGQTLDWMLDQMNHDVNGQVWWSGWAYKTVQMDRWGLYNFGNSMRVDVSADDFDTIKSQWSNMGPISKSRVADQYAAASGGTAPNRKRSLGEEDAARVERSVSLPRVGGRSTRKTPHGGRSRRFGA